MPKTKCNEEPITKHHLIDDVMTTETRFRLFKERYTKRKESRCYELTRIAIKLALDRHLDRLPIEDLAIGATLELVQKEMKWATKKSSDYVHDLFSIVALPSDAKKVSKLDEPDTRFLLTGILEHDPSTQMVSLTSYGRLVAAEMGLIVTGPSGIDQATMLSILKNAKKGRVAVDLILDHDDQATFFKIKPSWWKAPGGVEAKMVSLCGYHTAKAVALEIFEIVSEGERFVSRADFIDTLDRRLTDKYSELKPTKCYLKRAITSTIKIKQALDFMADRKVNSKMAITDIAEFDEELGSLELTGRGSKIKQVLADVKCILEDDEPNSKERVALHRRIAVPMEIGGADILMSHVR